MCRSQQKNGIASKTMPGFRAPLKLVEFSTVLPPASPKRRLGKVS